MRRGLVVLVALAALSSCVRNPHPPVALASIGIGAVAGGTAGFVASTGADNGEARVVGGAFVGVALGMVVWAVIEWILDDPPADP